jgi:hypothetical protein
MHASLSTKYAGEEECGTQLRDASQPSPPEMRLRNWKMKGKKREN